MNIEALKASKSAFEACIVLTENLSKKKALDAMYEEMERLEKLLAEANQPKEPTL